MSGWSGRWQKHLRRLVHKIHPNSHLQNAWNKQNGNEFRLEIIEQCPPDQLFEHEQKYLDIAKTELDKCYNKSFIAGGIEMTNAVKEKIRRYRTGKIHSDESKRKMSLKRTGKSPSNKGIPMSLELKDKHSKNWVFRSPTNEIVHIRNLNKFCKENGLHCGHMQEVFIGKHNHHKEWRRHDQIV